MNHYVITETRRFAFDAKTWAEAKAIAKAGNVGLPDLDSCSLVEQETGREEDLSEFDPLEA